MASTSTPASPYQTCRWPVEKKTRSRPCHFPFRLEGATAIWTVKRQGAPTLSWRGFQEMLAKAAVSHVVAGVTIPRMQYHYQFVATKFALRPIISRVWEHESSQLTRHRLQALPQTTHRDRGSPKGRLIDILSSPALRITVDLSS